ncbi:protein disulfide-isomerase TMX3 isoform X2 [Pipistrellus kuhlii]|uniref:protein disulfide-isomerase TMX3 isoform X2 n=1 Tax=Pipistrellus kuhlii TaxID=59472 RepID=UPI00174EEAD3|nr:protein disulfide-isomerase TMX3 isoform X2 [Pipistrellus kuhlii]
MPMCKSHGHGDSALIVCGMVFGVYTEEITGIREKGKIRISIPIPKKMACKKEKWDESGSIFKKKLCDLLAFPSMVACRMYIKHLTYLCFFITCALVRFNEVFVFLLEMAFCKGYVEDLDESFKDNRKDDIWLVDFYAPWCGHCKKLEPIWNEVGLEMKNIGSPVKVGKMDATSYSSIASEFGVRGYPTIKLLKGDLAYNYRGPRTKDDIIEFAHRVSGALIRPLPSQQMFEHVRKRHRVFFVYIGGESTLKEKYIDAASELIVYTYFFSASEEVVPEYVTLKEMPAVLVFKDETYFVYDEYEDGDLSSWINRERFQNYLTMDGFLLYELGDTGKLVAIAVIDEKNTSIEHTRLKSIIQEVARDYRDQFHSELTVPTVVVLNTSNQQYFLLDRQIKNTEDMVQFINSILDGTVEAQGGDSILQRLKRMAFDAKSTVVSIFKSSPIMGCFLFGLPLGVISIMCYGIYTADTDGGYIEERYEVSKSETESQEATEESRELQEPRSEQSLISARQEPKDVLEKKTD